MRWRNLARSTNVEDRRGGGGRGMMVAGGGVGTVLLVVAGLLFGFDPSAMLGGGGDGAPSMGPAQPVEQTPEQREQADFVAAVLGSTEEVWQELFRAHGEPYREPNLVLFDGQVRSACGYASAAVGPFYCPADQKAYIDLSFFRELERRFGAPGDFARAYVLAHEVGHHIQNLLGTSQRVQMQRQRIGQAAGNALSVRLELQADCYAGVWAHHADRTRDILEEGDIEEALMAASAIGDDALQRQSQGHVVPDSFTHGTSAQRTRWFKQGWTYGDLEKCDTFQASSL